jgi:hypothetical protein
MPLSDKQKEWFRSYGIALGKWVIPIVIGIAIALIQGKTVEVPIPSPPIPTPFPVGQGWVADPDSVDAVVQGLPENQRNFAATPAGKAVFGDDQDVFLWEIARKAIGKPIPARNQGNVGSCVGFGTVCAVEYLVACQIQQDREAGRVAGEWKDLSQEVVYGGSRVEVGGGRLRGDGSVGAWAADFVRKWGVAPRGKYASADLSAYNESICRAFGSTGVPDELEVVTRQSPVKAVAPVNDAESAVKALRQGYPIAVCSNQGFSSQRGPDGFARPQGQWAHCMAIIGYQAGPRRGFFIMNSWGEAFFQGPMGKGSPPEGGFWADFTTVNGMLRQNDSWAFSEAAGFPAKQLDWFVQNPQPQRNDVFAAFNFAH